MIEYPIDIVVPWVDGSDENWLNERSKYRPSSNADGSSARYREWGLFHYWFRSIEAYAPWVRKVHLITWGHLPPFLNTNHEKLNIVKHSDYIPKEYLPTFSSHVIELNLHRIEGLSEHFIYFNDDVYLNKPTKPEDFFKNGIPVDTAVFSMVRIYDNFSFMPYIELNMLGNLNMVFSKKKCIAENPFKWFNLKYGKDMLFNLYLFPGKNISGFKNYHSCIPYCKKTLAEVWEAFPEALDNTCRNKFRSREDVNQYLFRYWRLMKGEFAPGKVKSRYLTLGYHTMEEVSNAFNSKYKVICVNDDPMSCDFETEQKKAIQLFNKKYPNISSFETENNK